MIHLCTLGRLDLRETGSRTVDALLSQPKRTAILVYLALASPRGFKRRDTLLALFWPEHDEPRARAALNKALHLMRKALGPETIVSRGDEVGLDWDRIRCDAVDFERLAEEGRHAEALELYKGELLPAFYLSDSPEFERWLDDERARLRERARGAALSLIEEARARGDDDAAAEFARRALEIADDERALRALIELLDAAGDRAGALREYQRFAQLLEEEFEATPSPETVALIERIRSREELRELAEPSEPAEKPAPASPPVAAGEAPAEDPDPPESSAPDTPSAADAARPAPESPAPTASAAGQVSARRRSRRVTIMVALAIIAAFGFLIGTRSPAITENRVLVATFEYRGDDPALEPIGRSVAELIAQELAGTNLVEIVDPATAHAATHDIGGARRGARPRNRLRDAARRTGAAIVVSGSYQRLGDSLRFDAWISDISRGELLAAVGPYNAPVDEPLLAIEALHDRVAGALAMQLDPRLEFMGALGGPPPRFAAYQMWMNGVEAFGRMDFPNAIADLQRAHELDPGFATPLIWMALAFANAGRWGEVESLLGRIAEARATLGAFDQHFVDLIEAWHRGRILAQYEAARRMVEVAPHSEIALVLLSQAALMIDRPHETLETLARIEMERIPTDFKHWIASTLGDALHLTGDYEAQLELARRLRADRPANPALINQEAMALAALGRTEELLPAIESVRSRAYGAALELRAHGHDEALAGLLARAERLFRGRLAAEPDDDEVRRQLAFILYLAGEWEEAGSIFRELSARDPGSLLLVGMSGVNAALLGDREAALETADQIVRVTGSAGTAVATTYWRARIAAALGDRERTVQLLRESFDHGNTLIPQAIHQAPEFAIIHDTSFLGDMK